MAEEIEQTKDTTSFFDELPPLDDDHPRNASFDRHYGDTVMQEAAFDGIPWILDSFQNDSLYSSSDIISDQKLFEDDSFECGNEFEFQPIHHQVICSENDLVEKVTEPVITKSEEHAKGFGVVKRKSNTDCKKLSREKISEYYNMPIKQAAKELNVGLTPLKKNCREVGISRWPYRKVKSLKNLIQTVQAQGKEEGEGGYGSVSYAKNNLEDKIRLMEEAPDTELDDETKKLRQACYKANYKKKIYHG